MRTSRRVRVRFISALALIAAGTILIEKTTLFSAKKKTILIGPSQSSLIALGRDEQFLVNVNPDSDTITIFRTLPHKTKEKEVEVGHNPSSVAITPDGGTAYVSNAGDGTVNEIQLTPGKIRGTIKV